MTLTICVMIVVIGLCYYDYRRATKRPESMSKGVSFDDSTELSTPYRESRWDDDYRCPGKLHSEEFYENLVKTIAYTERIIDGIKAISPTDFAYVLRTFNPIYEGRPLYTFSSAAYGTDISVQQYFDYPEVLGGALLARAEVGERIGNVAVAGKILVFEFDISTCDGAPTSSSDGFVDNMDIPPIDTWFFVTSKFLYCWIPTMFVSKMQDAIDVEILDSYAWLEVVDPTFNREIMDRLQTQFP